MPTSRHPGVPGTGFNVAKKYTSGLQTILFDRGVEKQTRVIDGITFTASLPAPAIYHFRTANEGDFYLLADGSPAPGKAEDYAAEFKGATEAKRAPKF